MPSRRSTPRRRRFQDGTPLRRASVGRDVDEEIDLGVREGERQRREEIHDVRIDAALRRGAEDHADQPRLAGGEALGVHIGPVVQPLGALEYALARCNPDLGKAVEGTAHRGRRQAQMLGKLANGRHPFSSRVLKPV